VRRWSASFRLGIARRIRSTALAGGDKWHLDEVVVTINGKKHWLWRAVDQHGEVLDVLVQSRRKQGLGAERGTSAAQRTEQPG
jgi:putative transposase